LVGGPYSVSQGLMSEYGKSLRFVRRFSLEILKPGAGMIRCGRTAGALPMRPNPPNTDLFRIRLSNILDQRHALLRLAGLIGWSRFEQEYGALYAEQGRPGLPTYFQHELPLERSSMSRWRERIGADKIETVLAESIAVALKGGAVEREHFERVTIDTTVETHPSDSHLLYRGIDGCLSSRTIKRELRRRSAVERSWASQKGRSAGA
jgi:hypothetical protein